MVPEVMLIVVAPSTETLAEPIMVAFLTSVVTAYPPMMLRVEISLATNVPEETEALPTLSALIFPLDKVAFAIFLVDTVPVLTVKVPIFSASITPLLLFLAVVMFSA
jgi:hypothetical protein